MRTDSSPLTIYRKDYTPPAYLVETVELGFDLDPSRTIVANRITMQRNPDGRHSDIVLHGEDIELVQLRLNGAVLQADQYEIDGVLLTIRNAPEHVVLEIETLCAPVENTTLSGLYVSNDNFFTQCEAEGFRRITYFPDRPDVMARYTVMLRADKATYPVLLSNGNLIEEGDLGDGRHYAKWEDPFKKPSYLFALVAARLVCQEETYTLNSGREVLLQVWVEDGNLDKTDYAMQSLKNSIRWDEERFGLELDLDRFMIVAVGDFNMGAMENKGLNIFNTKFVLANPRVATDVDYAGIEAVVGHEYFHNWTGNRVTCRDWFQLSLKEGLTVFRDQEFSADMIGSDSGRAVTRIDQVRTLRQAQFPEDAGPMSHPVRPDSFVEINNFYTVTVYEKGAEVVRMYQTLVGRDGFRKGMDLYFERHDGQAVTCDDFRAAMADANGRDLGQFERWYSQAGTPVVTARTRYDAVKRNFDIILSQRSNHPDQLPFHIPVAVGLLGEDGRDLPLTLDGAHHDQDATTVVLELTQPEQIFRFRNIDERPTPSILRDFSAPVILEYDYTDDELLHLFRHDSDPVNRWEAGQRLAMARLLKLTAQLAAGSHHHRDKHGDKPLKLDATFLDAQRALLTDDALDPAFRELALILPSEGMIAEQMDVVDPHAIHAARQFMRRTIGAELRTELLAQYHANQTPGEYSPDALSAGKRALKNLCLSYLLTAPDAVTLSLAQHQCEHAGNMTDRFAALVALIHSGTDASAYLQRFYDDFANEALVIDKWFAMQAATPTTDVACVRKLMQHPAFTLKNPNRARSLLFNFTNANPSQFHAADGSAYAFWAEHVIKLDAINPQVAARFARSMDRWRRYAPALQTQMKAALEQVAAHTRLSNDVLEVITKALAN
ncbi:aminopeptidase [Duganella sp. Leaf126]|uniref:aminopeptidase N n=1 Tax=Duganella sp. Leaf126 TaxID=1736266 RepID=UPI0007005572|nr:aminopeptidase N [Duganella sp. Leaf126]KQQ33625.1 aminopeptidase [Duganella sp. Leaf126]